MILWFLVTSESRWIIAIVLLVLLPADEPICDQERTWQWLSKPKQRPCVITKTDGHEIDRWLDFSLFWCVVCEQCSYSGSYLCFVDLIYLHISSVWCVHLLVDLLNLGIHCNRFSDDHISAWSKMGYLHWCPMGSLLWHWCQAWMSPSFDALPKQGGTRLPNLASKHLLPLGRWGCGSGKE